MASKTKDTYFEVLEQWNSGPAQLRDEQIEEFKKRFKNSVAHEEEAEYVERRKLKLEAK